MGKSKSILGAIVSNWQAKALSLLAAVILFAFHNFSAVSERFISVDLKTVFAEGLCSAEPYPHRIQVEIRGKDRNFAAATEVDIEAVADFSHFTETGLSTTPVTIIKRGVLEEADGVEVEAAPKEITLLLETKTRKRVNVVPVFRGAPAAGYSLGQYSVNPSEIDVEGPLSAVAALSSISTEEINLSGRREAFNLRVRLAKASPLFAFPGGDTADIHGQILETAALDKAGARP